MRIDCKVCCKDRTLQNFWSEDQLPGAQLCKSQLSPAKIFFLFNCYSLKVKIACPPWRLFYEIRWHLLGHEAKTKQETLSVYTANTETKPKDLSREICFLPRTIT